MPVWRKQGNLRLGSPAVWLRGPQWQTSLPSLLHRHLDSLQLRENWRSSPRDYESRDQCRWRGAQPPLASPRLPTFRGRLEVLPCFQAVSPPSWTIGSRDTTQEVPRAHKLPRSSRIRRTLLVGKGDAT